MMNEREKAEFLERDRIARRFQERITIRDVAPVEVRNAERAISQQSTDRTIRYHDASTGRFTIDARRARAVWAEFRGDHGRAAVPAPLLTAPGHQPKTAKNATPTYVLHLAPATLSGVDVCPFAGECARVCLNSAGRGRFDNVQSGRILRTRFMVERPTAFSAVLAHEIRGAVRRHHGRALFRLNGTSDIRWERTFPDLLAVPGAEYYDYTKWPRRPDVPDNYSICYSASERDTDADLIDRLDAFGYVAVVVDTPAYGRGKTTPLPRTYLGRQAWDGDITDDWRGTPGFILLRAKGDAVGDRSGFVRPTYPGTDRGVA